METRKTLFASLAFLFLGLVPNSAMGQSLPHTFSANTAAKASEVNENFTYLLERFGTRQTSVNCSAGESITTALQNYNHIVISGICTENLNLDATTFPHRLVILEGSSSSSDGINASDTSDEVIYVKGLITLKISKLKLTGDTYGIASSTGPSVILENTLVENNTNSGIAIWSNSGGWIENSTIQNNSEHAIFSGWSSHVNIIGNTISGHTNNQSIKITRSGSAWIENNTITNGKYAGISIDRGASADIISNTIQSAEHGISVLDSSHAILKNNTVNSNSNSGLYVDNNASVILAEGNTFSYNSNYGITLWLGGSLNMWCDAQLTTATTISNNTQGAINVNSGSTANLCNLSLSSPSKGINTGLGAMLNLQNITITNSQDDGVHLWGAKGWIDNITITGNANAGIRVNNGMLSIQNSTISGSTKGGIESHQQSAIHLGGGVIIENNAFGIGLTNSTLFQYDDESTSYIRNNTNNEIDATMSSIGLSQVTVGGTSGNTEIYLSQGSILRIGTGTSITGTILCDGSLNTGKFIKDTITLNPTTSGC